MPRDTTTSLYFTSRPPGAECCEEELVRALRHAERARAAGDLELVEDADRGGKETSTSSSTIDDSASRSAKKARTGELSLHTAIDGLQVGDRVMSKVKGCARGAEGYPAGLWPAKVIGKLKGNRVKIEWMQVVVAEFSPSAFRCMDSHVVLQRRMLLYAHIRKHTHKHANYVRIIARPSHTCARRFYTHMTQSFTHAHP